MTSFVPPSGLPSLFPDLDPTPQIDVSPVCSIQYTADFVVAYDYLRTVLRTDERSDRTLRLTGLCLKLNPANYTVWHFRRRILGALERGGEAGDARGRDGGDGDGDGDEKLPPLDVATLKSEQGLASTLGGANPKNYQIWYHRRALLEPIFAAAAAAAASSDGGSSGYSPDAVLDVARDELSYISTVLAHDAKNYHAWSHRQYVLRSCDTCLTSTNLWQSDLSYTDELISTDMRNNSAWNHRWFVTHRGLHVPLSLDEALSECRYALSKAELDPHNESPWIYLVGLVKEQARSKSDNAVGSAEKKKKELVVSMLAEAERIRKDIIAPDVACPNADSARIELLDVLSSLVGDAGDDGDGVKEVEEVRAKAAALAHNLGTVDDTIRRKYWAKREVQLARKKTEAV